MDRGLVELYNQYLVPFNCGEYCIDFYKPTLLKKVPSKTVYNTGEIAYIVESKNINLNREIY